MKFQFSKDLEYQIKAIDSVVKVFDTGRNLSLGIERDLDILQYQNHIQVVKNEFEIDEERILENIKHLQEENEIVEKDEKTKEIIKYTLDEKHLRDITVEMETGTGKTYVYLRTIFELNKKYNLKKFIILVPSVAIREGVLKSIEYMREHFKSLYEVNFKGFGYDSDKLNEVRDFAGSNNLIIMIMTVQSFNNDKNVMRQSPDRFNGNRPIDLVANTQPIIIMDEPQNMETDLAKEAIEDLNPLFKLRYSATHKNIYNPVYRLTPIEAYKENLVKKIEVLGVKESNNNERLIEVKEIITSKKEKPKAKVLLAVKSVSGEYQDKVVELKLGDDLERKTKNEIYKNLVVYDVNARENRVELSDGKFYPVEENTKNLEEVFRVQIRETIKTHLDKQKRLNSENIKVLSLFFIDKVDNYIHPDSMIRKIFEEEFNRLKVNYPDFQDKEVKDIHKGYFASRKVKGEVIYENSINGNSKKDKEAYDLIMKDKDRLLSFSENVAFIFSHSALKEGWDNPNIFQICTLRETKSIMKKRQEVGRGLRLPVNQDGVRISDEKINILTIIPNESYRDFCDTYQSEMDEDGYKISQEPNNARKKITVKLNKNIDSEIFKELWSRIGRKTKYTLEIKTENLIEKVVEKVNQLNLNNPVIKIETGLIYFTKKDRLEVINQGEKLGSEIKYEVRINNFIERISKEAGITRDTVYKIFSKLENLDLILKNYEDYIRNIILIILDEKNNILLEEGLKYTPIDDYYEVKILYEDLVEIYEKSSLEVKNSVADHINYDSDGERKFAENLDNDPRVRIFTKLPSGFVVETPFGKYNPDWALVLEVNDETKLYLVRETKFYDNKKLEEVLKKSELNKIESAKKHFESIKVNYKVVKDKDLRDLI